MANKLDEKFRDNYKNAMNCYRLGDEDKCLEYLKVALQCLYTLGKESLNLDLRQKYLSQAEKIRPFYDDLKAKRGVVVETAPTKKPTPTKKQEQNKENPDEINNIVNGIDVTNYLATTSEDEVTFDDVIGMENEKELIKREFSMDENIIALKKKLGVKQKNFIMLYGLPGTGKTFFAKAISNQLGIPFFSAICTQLKGSLHGDSEKNIIALFKYCEQYKRCILFLDEFESIALDRNSPNSSEVTKSTVATLLQMLDGFSTKNNVLLIAATNTPYSLDSAVLSRANLMIEIPLPEKEVILQTLKCKFKDNIDKNIDLNKLADRLIGYSNRDIKNFIAMVNDYSISSYQKALYNNPDLSVEDWKINQEHIDYCLNNSSKATKIADKMLIEKFKKDHGLN